MIRPQCLYNVKQHAINTERQGTDLEAMLTGQPSHSLSARFRLGKCNNILYSDTEIMYVCVVDDIGFQ